MNGDSQFQLGERLAGIESKLDSMTTALTELKQGVGARVECHDKEIAVLDERVSVISKVGWAILGTALSSIVVAILSLVIKRG